MPVQSQLRRARKHAPPPRAPKRPRVFPQVVQKPALPWIAEPRPSPPLPAEIARMTGGLLHDLMKEASLHAVDDRQFLVLPVNDALLEEIAVAEAASEDLEEETDQGVDDTGEDDRENEPAFEDEDSLGWPIGEEPRAGYDPMGASERDDNPDREDSLGWPIDANGHLTSGHAPCGDSEGDGDPDAEDDDPGGGNADDEGEEEFADKEPGTWRETIDQSPGALHAGLMTE